MTGLVSNLMTHSGRYFRAPRMPPTCWTDVHAKFSKFFRRAGLDLSEKMNSGRRNLSVVKVSASYDIWRPKKYRKTENKIFKKFRTKKLVFRNFGMVFEELQPNEPQNQVRRQILLQIHIS